MRSARAIVFAVMALVLLSSTAWAEKEADSVWLRSFVEYANDFEFWKSIKDGGDRALFEAYLDQYPSGTFAPIARRELEKLDPTEGAAIAPVPPSYTIEERDAPYVISSTANVLSGPGIKHDTLATLQIGTEVTVTGEVKGQDWYRIALKGGSPGFVYAALVRDKASWDRAHFAPVRPGATFRDCAECPDMVVIAPGSFQMGDLSSDAEDQETPVQTVSIDYTLAVGQYEVTRDQYARFVSATGRSAEDGCYHVSGLEVEKSDSSSWRSPGFAQTGADPVVCVNWVDAKAYVAWLSRTTDKPYRLLSEAEWEYVARGGKTTKYPFGESIGELCNYGNGADAGSPFAWGSRWCSDGYGEETAPVGTYRANGFGVYDTVGNAAEWVEDCWHDSYAGAPSDGSAWIIGGECRNRVVRGGSWLNPPEHLRSASRQANSARNRNYLAGFRVARTVSEP